MWRGIEENYYVTILSYPENNRAAFWRVYARVVFLAAPHIISDIVSALLGFRTMERILQVDVYRGLIQLHYY